ncbi:MAG TPA: hypothetical protein VJ553_07430 [Candidatus Paceibacterota bacterium]|nr:hypothetical protein [Candidatus Paceibacterota bacterium]
MAIDFKLDDYGDIDLSSGDIELVDDADEVAQICETKILKVYDEDRLAQETGVEWFTRMYDVETEEKYKVLLLKTQILSIPEVTGLVFHSMSLDTDTGVVSAEITVDTIYSETPLQIGV